MGIDNLLSRLQTILIPGMNNSGVTKVTGVTSNADEAFGVTPDENIGVTRGYKFEEHGKSVTPVTPCNPAGVTGKQALTQAVTPVTPVTPKKTVTQGEIASSDVPTEKTIKIVSGEKNVPPVCFILPIEKIAPQQPCFICGGCSFWTRSAEHPLVCGKCHAPPASFKNLTWVDADAILQAHADREPLATVAA